MPHHEDTYPGVLWVLNYDVQGLGQPARARPDLAMSGDKQHHYFYHYYFIAIILSPRVSGIWFHAYPTFLDSCSSGIVPGLRFQHADLAPTYGGCVY